MNIILTDYRDFLDGGNTLARSGLLTAETSLPKILKSNRCIPLLAAAGSWRSTFTYMTFELLRQRNANRVK